MRVETDVGRAGAKDPRRDAIERQVLQEIEVLYRVALAITRNHADAEDLVQDTLLRAYRAIDRFDGKHPRAWLLTILRNAHINRNRRWRPKPLADPDTMLRRLAEVPDSAHLPEELIVDRAFDGIVASAFRALPERFRKAVQLVDIEGLSYQEAAAALGVPLGTVMSRLHRARSRMKRSLQAQGLVPSGRDGT